MLEFGSRHRNEFVPVRPDQKFAGGILTEAGAAEVNASRAKIAAGGKDPLSIRIAKSLRAQESKSRQHSKAVVDLRGLVDPLFFKSDQEVFPWLKLE